MNPSSTASLTSIGCIDAAVGSRGDGAAVDDVSGCHACELEFRCRQVLLVEISKWSGFPSEEC